MQKTKQAPWTKQELLGVAKYQKNIQWLVLAHLIAIFVPYATILTGIVGVYFIYKLASSLRSSCAWLYIILSFIPVIGVLALVHFVGKATKVLRENGISVGIMGAKMDDFKEIQDAAQ
ncbi:MAG: hypothetical protein WC334_00070 [Kiritimatiellales bacterium]|jgi:hypothetical protein